MEFKKYTSIENSYRQKVVDKIVQYYPKETFVVQEKIHGANFAIYVDGTGVRYAKRSGFLGEGENFFNSGIIGKRYESSAKKLFNCLNQTNEKGVVTSISIHGEIYGGSYPHKDVPKVKNVQKVQNKCYYSPDAQFIAFDMKINGEYINIEVMNELLDIFKIPRSEILLKGTLGECLTYPNIFPITLHGLPEIEGNTCEGTVIKSLEPKRLPNGERLILKNKNSKFSEKKNKMKPVIKEFPQHVVPFVESALSYVTENRLRNVLSKIGPVTDQRTAFGVIMKPFNLDVIEDFTKENKGFLELEKSDRKIVTREVNVAVGNMIRANLFNIIDGEF